MGLSAGLFPCDRHLRVHVVRKDQGATWGRRFANPSLTTRWYAVRAYGADDGGVTCVSLGSMVGSGNSGTMSQPTSRSSSARSSRAHVMRQ